ncbi:MAG: discoidin domain-containing protein [Clostridia bacterium]|nr:discoidin domain-containing protein [Clostridia bacterium]
MKKTGTGFKCIAAAAAVLTLILLLCGCASPGGPPVETQPTAGPDGTVPEPGPTPVVIIPEADTYKGDNAEMNKKTLELFIGEKDKISIKDTFASVKWETTDPGVAVVDEETGEITGVGCGNCVIIAKGTDVKASCRVYVVEKEFSFDDNILISIFWPPTREYVNDEQYKYMADAQIDWVMSAGDDLNDDEVQLKMLELCYKYGIHMTAAPHGTGSALLSSSSRDIKNVVEKYRNIPGVNGYYMLDEPLNPNTFLNAYIAMKEQDPSAYMHLNFLPYGAYGSVETYVSQVNDWAKLCAGAGYPLEYLMYDLYPFGLEKGSMNRTAFLTNLNAIRIAGLRNNVKTANYIQSVEQSVAFRSPNREETLYEINMSLAYGIKQISYFTWFTPHDRSEPFEDGIISRYGVPNPKYSFICELNDYVHKIGKTLIRCDAPEVWQGRSTYSAAELVPEDYFVKFKSKADFTLTYLRDKYNGRNYVMAVNNSFQKAGKCTLVFDSGIKGNFAYVDEKDGTLKALAVKNDGSVDLELEAGAAIIIALPEEYDYSSKNIWNPEDGENLARHAEITCSSSAGSGGHYMDNLNNGDRYGKTSDGWQSEGAKKASTITLAFEKPAEFNRVDVYPKGNFIRYGDNAPDSYVLYTSDDGKEWKALDANVASCDRDELKKITFGTVTAAYLRIECDNAKHKINLFEIEVYNDKGNVPDPVSTEACVRETRGVKTVSYKEGANLALGRSVTVSSYPASPDYKSWGWWPDNLVDGDRVRGWTSNVKANTSADSAEYAIIDLGDCFTISEVDVYPNGCWPKNFEIRVSDDMTNWTVIASETNSKKPGERYSCSGGGASGRYVLFLGTKLTNTAADGYMLQLGEIEVYGTPCIDYAEAEKLAARFIELGGSPDDADYKSVIGEIEKTAGSSSAKGVLTQSKLDKMMKKMLEKVGTTIEKETENSAGH